MYRKNIKHLILCVSFMLTLCACQVKSSPQDTSGILREMVQNYGRTGDSAQTAAYLEKLRTLTPDLAENWQDIMAYWDLANHSDINYDMLPNDLPDTESLCIVVLGYQLNADGTMKEELTGRLNTALSCAQQYPNAFVLCTGGGTASKNRNATEAGTMAQWLAGNGIAQDRLIIEDQSLTTTQNAIFSCHILAEQYPQVHSIVIVTSNYHIPWGSVLFHTQLSLSDKLDAKVVAHVAFAPPQAISYDVRNYQMDGILEIAGLK